MIVVIVIRDKTSVWRTFFCFYVFNKCFLLMKRINKKGKLFLHVKNVT